MAGLNDYRQYDPDAYLRLRAVPQPLLAPPPKQGDQFTYQQYDPNAYNRLEQFPTNAPTSGVVETMANGLGAYYRMLGNQAKNSPAGQAISDIDFDAASRRAVSMATPIALKNAPVDSRLSEKDARDLMISQMSSAPGLNAEEAQSLLKQTQPAAAATTPPVYTGGSLPPGVSGIGENARLGLKEVNRYGELLRQGYTPLETQGAAPSGSLDAGVMARTAATRTEPDGTQYEQRQYALPGGGEVSGWRAVDPNRPKGSFSVVPGLSDFEKRRYAELMGEERRQAAYQAGQGRQYDALLAKQAEQQVEWNKARLGQENQDRDYEIKRAQLQQSADQNRMNASKSGLEARQKEADAITAALGGVDKMPQYQDYEKLFYERNPAAKKEDVLEGVLAPLGVSALDPTGKNPQDLPGQYLDKAKGVIALRGPDGKYREYSPNEYIRLLNQQRAMEQARLIAQTRAQLYGPQNP